ncbi:hypothetical protein WA158_004151 [Blastocystis sp. Blastoise]
MKRYCSDYPKIESIDSVNACNLDRFLKDSIDGDEKLNLVVVDDNEDTIDIFRNYIDSHEYDGTYYFVGCSEILSQYKQWFKIFKDIQPFYAVKCNPEQAIVRLMSTFPNMCYDCASPAELQSVFNTGLGPERTIYANPIKSAEGIRYMQKHNVMVSTIDCVEELEKMFALLGSSFCEFKLVIRLWVDDSHSSVPLGSKFGAHISEIPAIMAKIQEYNGQYIGVSFHVGSGCSDGYAYDNAIHTASDVAAIARDYGYDTTFLDLGGGWSGWLESEHNSELQERSEIVRNAIKKYHLEGVEVIAEPGRFFVDRSIHMCVTIDRKILNKESFNNTDQIEEGQIIPTFKNGSPIAPKYKVYENHSDFFIKKDIIYQLGEGYEGGFKDRCLCDKLFSCQPLFVNINKHIAKRTVDSQRNKPIYNCLLVGPSENRQEIINDNSPLPLLPNGDWLVFPNQGSYTMSICTKQVRQGQRIVFFIRRNTISDEMYQYYLNHYKD